MITQTTTTTATSKREGETHRYDVTRNGELVGVLRSTDIGVVTRWFADNFTGVEIPSRPPVKLNWRKHPIC